MARTGTGRQAASASRGAIPHTVSDHLCIDFVNSRFADHTGASIPIAGFAQLTLVFSLVGVGIAAVMARKVRRPRPTFARTAVALTALSFVPDLTFGFDTGSAATLITLHTVAAAIVVPTLAGRLARTR